jgi:hypothetical protein
MEYLRSSSVRRRAVAVPGETGVQLVKYHTSDIVSIYLLTPKKM